MTKAQDPQPDADEQIKTGSRILIYLVEELGDARLRAAQLKRYARICGWTLARAHAKSGDAATISGYLGKSDAFDRALGEFALAYADQTRKDHAALVKAIGSGRVEALQEY